MIHVNLRLLVTKIRASALIVIFHNLVFSSYLANYGLSQSGPYQITEMTVG